MLNVSKEQRRKQLNSHRLQTKTTLNAKLCTVSGRLLNITPIIIILMEFIQTASIICFFSVCWSVQPSVRSHHLAKVNSGLHVSISSTQRTHISPGPCSPPQSRGLAPFMDASWANRWLTPAEAAGYPSSHLHDCFSHADSQQTGLDCCSSPDPTGLVGGFSRKVMLKKGSNMMQHVHLL